MRSRHRRLRAASPSASLTTSTASSAGAAAASASSCDASPWSSWSSTSTSSAAGAGPRAGLDLSTPGPEYLRFLAEYSFEIRVAEEMFRPRRAAAAAAEADPFGSWVGLYCVRRFLERLRRVALDEAGRYEHEQELLARTREEIEWFYA